MALTRLQDAVADGRWRSDLARRRRHLTRLVDIWRPRGCCIANAAASRMKTQSRRFHKGKRCIHERSVKTNLIACSISIKKCENTAKETRNGREKWTLCSSWNFSAWMLYHYCPLLMATFVVCLGIKACLDIIQFNSFDGLPYKTFWTVSRKISTDCLIGQKIKEKRMIRR